MEATASMAASVTLVGQTGSESSTPAVYADEDPRHFAIAAIEAPKPTGAGASPPAPATPDSSCGKDLKSLGTRFHEDCHETDLISPRLRSSRIYKGKGKEAVAVQQEKKRPLRLLDLPVDVLKEIVKEVTHTNDLTSLARCHSALHRLAVPHIYSRFDIVWPDSTPHAEPRSGVDALTYGLATLVMAEEIFGEAPGQHGGASNRFNTGGIGHASETQIRRRRGNHYAQFTRKLSLGNGPTDWVQEYLISKEGGKMLGTLVALAVARMRSLETFIWDMPTGVLRDVWAALSSLGDRNDGHPCRLEKLWVRWHDNSSVDAASSMSPPPLPVPLNAIPAHAAGHNSLEVERQIAQLHAEALDRVEHPSFSVLPPLKSLSVLDIDELAYLDEMAVLIGRSAGKLRELRVGIARHALERDWIPTWDSEDVQQVDYDYPTVGLLTIGEKRLGGVLGILVGFVHDMRRPTLDSVIRTKQRRSSLRSANRNSQTVNDSELLASPPILDPDTTSSILNEISNLRDALPDLPGTEPAQQPAWPTNDATPPLDAREENNPLSQVDSHDVEPTSATGTHDLPQAAQAMDVPSTDDSDTTQPNQSRLQNVLQLETLELERVPLSIEVLQQAFDWTKLTSLTILYCENHEQLWKMLRQQFAPTPKSPKFSQLRRASGVATKKASRAGNATHANEMSYALKLKKIHTNTVSPALVHFMKETLAPNSLEVLFLQEARLASASVTIDALFKGALKRHRTSLKKVLIDSSEKRIDGATNSSSKWRRWMLTRDILAFILSGKMPALRELGAALDYRDWHFFLQHLPSVPHLRSLYIPFLADHIHGANADPRELALQIVDIVALRPEVELCYMGIANKCFEILENRRESHDGRTESAAGIGPSGLDDPTAHDDGEDDEDDEADVEELDDGEEAEDEEEQVDSDDDDEEDDDGSESGESAGAFKGAAKLRLREILFYDDKVAVFKARHGRL